MAISNTQTSKRLNAVYIISKIDDAVDWEASNEQAYRESLDEKHLVLVTGKEPTRFLCNFDLDARSMSLVEDAMISGVGADGRVKPGLGSYNLAVAKAVLRDIKNPSTLPVDEHIPFKRNADGFVHDEVLDTLSRLGIIAEIATAFATLTKSNITRNKADVKN